MKPEKIETSENLRRTITFEPQIFEIVQKYRKKKAFIGTFTQAVNELVKIASGDGAF